MFGLRKKTMEFWNEIYNSVKPWIVNPFWMDAKDLVSQIVYDNQ